MKFKNTFTHQLIRDGKVIAEAKDHNLITIQGANAILDIMFDGAAQVVSWYLGLIGGASSPTISNADTLASHAGWTEFTDYTGNRQVYDPDNPSAGAIVNSTTLCVFPITATGTIRGGFLTSAASGTSGTLFSAAAWAQPYSVINGDTYRVSYTMQLIA